MDVLTTRGGPLFALAILTVAACTTPPEPPSADEQAVFDAPVDVELVVAAERNAMRYALTRIEAPAGATVRLVMDNSATTSPAMVHNVVVLTDAAEATALRVGRAATGARDNIPDDPAVFAYTPLAGPGDRTAVVFEMPPPGEYRFVCTYPGHFQFMQGVLVSTAPAS